MENNFIQMPASAGHAVAYMNGPIFKHIIDYVQLYFYQWLHKYCPLKRQLSLTLVGVTLIFDDTPQIIVQRCQITADVV